MLFSWLNLCFRCFLKGESRLQWRRQVRRISLRKLLEKTGVLFAMRVEIFESVIMSEWFVMNVCVCMLSYVHVIVWMSNYPYYWTSFYGFLGGGVVGSLDQTLPIVLHRFALFNWCMSIGMKGIYVFLITCGYLCYFMGHPSPSVPI